MPITKGKSRAVIAGNIKRLMHEGKPMNQAIAISYNAAGKGKKSKSSKKK